MLFCRVPYELQKAHCGCKGFTVADGSQLFAQNSMPHNDHAPAVTHCTVALTSAHPPFPPQSPPPAPPLPEMLPSLWFQLLWCQAMTRHIQVSSLSDNKLFFWLLVGCTEGGGGRLPSLMHLCDASAHTLRAPSSVYYASASWRSEIGQNMPSRYLALAGMPVHYLHHLSRPYSEGAQPSQ